MKTITILKFYHNISLIILTIFHRTTSFWYIHLIKQITLSNLWYICLVCEIFDIVFRLFRLFSSRAANEVPSACNSCTNPSQETSLQVWLMLVCHKRKILLTDWWKPYTNNDSCLSSGYFATHLVRCALRPCSLGLSATSQQYFSLTTNQPPATSQQYFSLRTNQHQPSATSQTNRLLQLCAICSTFILSTSRSKSASPTRGRTVCTRACLWWWKRPS
jgi:hypothetical protein